MSPNEVALELDRQVGAKRDESAGQCAQKRSPFFLSAWAHIACLVAVVILIFGRTLTSYFLADDICEVAYVHQIFHGRPDLFWSNFVGNYMQIPGMSVYRPWLLISLVADYLLWGANAFGYYLTNLLYYAGDATLLYLIVKKLTRAWGDARSASCAFLSALLFAVSPLHCESVSWVVGRVDIICGFFYLLAFFLWLRGKDEAKSKHAFVAASVLSFLVGLCTKEMAIGLPVMISGAAFIFCPPGVRRIVAAVKESAPFWLATGAYFVIRLLSLGTLVGGYTAGFGAGQKAAMVMKWLDADTLRRLILPFSYAIFQDGSLYFKIAAAALAVAAILAVTRLMAREVEAKWLAFISLWFATAAIPIFQLWGLGYNLEGSRFYFFISMPLSVLGPVLLLSPSSTAGGARVQRSILQFGVLSLSLLALVFGRAAYITDLSWVHAGKEVARLRQSAKDLSTRGNVALLGLPKEKDGAHLILNGSTFATLLSEPFTSPPIAKQFLTFDPIMFGPAQYIDAARFKRSVREGAVKGAYLWSEDKQAFEPVAKGAGGAVKSPAFELSLDSSSSWQAYSDGHAFSSMKDREICLKNVRDGDGIYLRGGPIDPFATSFVEFDLRSKDLSSNPTPKIVTRVADEVLDFPISAKDGARTAAYSCSKNGSYMHIRLRLAHHWRWYTQGTVRDLALTFSGLSELGIRNLRFTGEEGLVPTLAVSGEQSNTGVYPLKAVPLRIKVSDAPSDAAVVRIMITKPNFFFDNIEAQGAVGGIGETVDFPLAPNGQTSVTIPGKALSQAGYYQVRAICTSPSGEPLGEYSDAITVQK